MITLATPWAVVRGPAGSTVDVYCGEDVRADGSAETQPRQFAMRYILRGGEAERVESYEAVGFRYLSIVARGWCADRIGGRNRAALSARRRGVLRVRRSGAQQNLARRRAHAGALLDRRLHRLSRPRATRMARRLLHPRAVDIHHQHRLAPRAAPSAGLRVLAPRRRSAGDGRVRRHLDFIDHDP